MATAAGRAMGRAPPWAPLRPPLKEQYNTRDVVALPLLLLLRLLMLLMFLPEMCNRARAKENIH